MNRGQNYLLDAATDGLHREPEPNRGDYIVAAVGIVGVVVILILNLLGVA